MGMKNRNRFFMIRALLLSFVLVLILIFWFSNRRSRVSKLDGLQNENTESQFLFVNKKFIESLLKMDLNDEQKFKEAFSGIKLFEPIIFGILPGDFKHTIARNENRVSSDVSSYKDQITYSNYSYTLINSENIFTVEEPDLPKEIMNQWINNDTVFYQTGSDRNMMCTWSLFIRDSFSILNSNVEMLNLNDFIEIPSNSYHVSSTFYNDLLEELIKKYCHHNLSYFYYKNLWTANMKNGIYECLKNRELVDYGICLNNSGQIPFKTKPLQFAQIMLFPRYAHRANFPHSLERVYGINQFFLDHDLTSGYVHDYTLNFFNRLPEDGYVLYLKRSESRILQGKISYKRKKDLNFNVDQLGQNFAFCRQWKLSEIDMIGSQIRMRRMIDAPTYFCPQLKPGKNPFNTEICEIPIRSIYGKDGYVDYHGLNSLTDYAGGTAVIIWETKRDGVLFMDIHGSIATIIEEALRIKANYNVDPVIGVYDAGPFARKFKADINGIVDFGIVDQYTMASETSGAGYGYLRP
jgi:hypothetical protein